MAKYLISFPSVAMRVPDGEWDAVVRDSHAVIDEARRAGVYVFGGGIDEQVAPVRVSADGAVAEGGYPSGPRLHGGFTVLELPTREDGVDWAARMRSGIAGVPVRSAVLNDAAAGRGRIGAYARRQRVTHGT
ncbi:YciI family protein [Luteimonas kalidii]|uniref:Transcription initiation protein n=1 Tax=Luteimonas kalidii TaxID=3042025 RepID=A0ABT6JRY0_9GAMM|nr:hypothetical protein [Luteimonas kalidii]MDH5832906.1 hypothetical protein [Luteimonas kalidii]